MDTHTIGRYQIVARLGQGGMGVVYRAFDPQIERTVAIKVISAQLGDQPEHRERFFREARAAGKLAHPNIITIFDLGEDNGQPYIAMEYVEGESLDVRMRRGEPLTLSQKVVIVIEICDALAFAHAAGIVHRDMKPANVMLTRGGGVRILDFGLARLVTSDLTRSNVVVGTMNYMAPEQVRAEAIDHRADVFAVGVLFYELLSGHKAFEADSFAATMYKVLQEHPVPLTTLASDVPPAIVTVVDRAMEKDRALRYQSAGDMLRDLEQIRAALPSAAPIRLSTGVLDPSPRTSPRTSSRLPLEPSTALEPPHVTGPRMTPAPYVRGMGTGAPYVDGSISAQPTMAARPRSDVTAASPATPSPAAASPPTPAPASGVVPGSRLVPIVSAAALVVIALAVVAFVFRSPALHTPPAADDSAGAAPAPAAAPAVSAAPPATRTESPPPRTGASVPTVGVTDDLAQQTESARALYRAGKYDEAARAAGRILQKAPGNSEAQRLMADVARSGRQAAADSVAALDGARARAESAGAPAGAAALFSRAQQAERRARTLLAAGDYAGATSAGYAAQGLFEAAATEALSHAARPTPDAGTAPPPTAPGVEPTVESSLPPMLPAPAAPAPAVAPPSPPAPAPVERRPADPAEGVRRALQQYTAALEARSLSALKQVWPGLGGPQERAIRAEFDNARQITVSLDSPRIQVSGETATVVATRRYALSTADGHELHNDTRSTFQLRATPGGWVIESIRFEAPR